LSGATTIQTQTRSLSSTTLNNVANAIVPFSGVRTGSYQIQVIYNGDGCVEGITKGQNLTVAPGILLPGLLNFFPSSIVCGQAFSIEVSIEALGTCPTGTVTILILSGTNIVANQTAILAVDILNIVKVGIFFTSLPAGTYQVQCFYNGDVNYPLTILGEIPLIIGLAPCIVDFAVSSLLGVVGQILTCKCHILPVFSSQPYPVGACSILDSSAYIQNDTLTSGALININLPLLNLGVHLLYCKFPGDSCYQSCTSPVQTCQINLL